MIDKLEFLIALAHERHFGRAAETCGVTQPTLSAGLKQLEGMLGVRLVNRGARFHDLTPEGQRVLDWARRICADARTLRAEIRGLRQGLAGHLRIGAGARIRQSKAESAAFEPSTMAITICLNGVVVASPAANTP